MKSEDEEEYEKLKIWRYKDMSMWAQAGSKLIQKAWHVHTPAPWKTSIIDTGRLLWQLDLWMMAAWLVMVALQATIAASTHP